jgi:hypothetical protein
MHEKHDLNFGYKSSSRWYQLDCIIYNAIAFSLAIKNTVRHVQEHRCCAALDVKTAMFTSINRHKGPRS